MKLLVVRVLVNFISEKVIKEISVGCCIWLLIILLYSKRAFCSHLMLSSDLIPSSFRLTVDYSRIRYLESALRIPYHTSLSSLRTPLLSLFILHHCISTVSKVGIGWLLWLRLLKATWTLLSEVLGEHALRYLEFLFLLHPWGDEIGANTASWVDFIWYGSSWNLLVWALLTNTLLAVLDRYFKLPWADLINLLCSVPCVSGGSLVVIIKGRLSL